MKDLVAMKLIVYLLVLVFEIVLGNVDSSEDLKFRMKRIVGGQPVTIEQYPWTAELRLTPDLVSCGAAVINRCFVLTSAHCFKWYPDIEIMVTMGTDLTYYNQALVLKAEKLIRYPTYDRYHTHDDIMLIKLNDTVNWTSNIQPVNLPEHDEDRANIDAIVLGFGRQAYGGAPSQRLHSVTLKLVDNKDCTKVFNSTLIQPTNICAGGEKGKDACQGDSGSPLVLKTNEKYYMIGVVSWGSHCAREGIPGVYTRISAYINWIHDVISQYGPECTFS